MNEAPRLRAAATSPTSMPRMLAYSVSTAYGTMIWTMPISTPVSLRTSVSGSSTMPQATSAELSGPCVPSSAIQAKDRTSTEIQNGSSTPTSISRCVRVLAARIA